MFALSKNAVIRNRDFTKIITRGKKVRGQYMTVYYLPADDYKTGIAVSKKVKRAVQRNRAKRRFKEILKRNPNKQSFCSEQVWMLEPELVTEKFTNIEKDYMEVVKKLSKQ